MDQHSQQQQDGTSHNIERQAQVQQQQAQRQQQQQQAQQSSIQQCLPVIDRAARDKLISMALSGDLARALQYASGTNNNNNGNDDNNNNFNGNGDRNGGGGEGAAAADISQQLEQLGIQLLQSGQVRNNNGGSTGSEGNHKNPTSNTAMAQGQEEEPSSNDTQPENRTKSTALHVAAAAAAAGTSATTPTTTTTNVSEKQGTKPFCKVVVPCRARGMSMKHNFQTAYFEIPDDVKHGDGLICSFPACRNRGVKFLYCAYCKDPVAKRNFRARHGHEDIKDSEIDMNGHSRSPRPDINNNINNNNYSRTAPKEAEEVVRDGQSYGDNQSGRDIKGIGSSSIPKVISSLRHIQPVSEATGSSSSAVSNNNLSDRKRPATGMASSAPNEMFQCKLAKIDRERKRQWEFLLATRPDSREGDEMSSWLMQVMAVSDLHRPAPDVFSQRKQRFENNKISTTESTPTSTEGKMEDDDDDDKNNNNEDHDYHYDSSSLSNSGDGTTSVSADVSSDESSDEYSADRRKRKRKKRRRRRKSYSSSDS